MATENRRSEKSSPELRQQLRSSYINLSVPSVKQEKDYTCGPASLQAVCAYYGVQISQEELEKICGTSEKKGTSYRGMIDAANELGFGHRERKGATIRQIEQKINRGKPVIVAYMLDNRDETSLPNKFVSGGIGDLPKVFRGMREGLVVDHLSIVSGYDDKNLFVLNVATGKNVKYNKAEFEKAWYDSEGTRWMMTVYPK